MPFINRPAILGQLPTVLCCLTAGGFVYLLYEVTANPSSLQPQSHRQRRSLKFESGNSSCPLTPSANNTQRFDFQGLYYYLQNISANCSPNDPRLVHLHGEAFLTFDAVRRWTGEKRTTWNPYPDNDILKRLLSWKLPIVNLLAQVAKQPLSFSIELSTISHLVGDPIDTLASMFYTLHVCLERVKLLRRLGLTPREWKAVVLVMQAFDECSGQNAMLELENR
jgi:hypothetical protein